MRGCPLHQLPRQRGDAGEALEKVERHPLARQDAARPALDHRDAVAVGDGLAVNRMQRDHQARVHLAEHHVRDGAAGEDIGPARQDVGARARLVVHQRDGGHVCLADILPQGPPNQILDFIVIDQIIHFHLSLLPRFFLDTRYWLELPAFCAGVAEPASSAPPVLSAVFNS